MTIKKLNPEKAMEHSSKNPPFFARFNLSFFTIGGRKNRRKARTRYGHWIYSPILVRSRKNRIKLRRLNENSRMERI